MDTLEIAPDDKYVVWSTGGSTDSDTGVTKPSKLKLTRLSDGVTTDSLALTGATGQVVWLTPTAFVSVQRTNVLSEFPNSEVYLVKVQNGKMRARLIYSQSNRRVGTMRIDDHHLLLLEEDGTREVFVSLSTAGTRRVVKTVSNPKDDIYTLVTPKE